MTKLFRLCTGSLRCTKYLLVQELLLFLKLVVLCNYLILFQKYIKWSLIMWKISIIKVIFSLVSRKFWVVENSLPIINTLNKTNARKKAKTIPTFDISTLYTTIPHNFLVKVLWEIIKFIFNSKTCTRVGFSSAFVYWASECGRKSCFTEETLINVVSYRIRKCYFAIGNTVFKQNVGIPMRIDPVLFWTNLFLNFFGSKSIQ